MRQQRDKVFAAAEIDPYGIALGERRSAAAVAAVGMNRHHPGARLDAVRRFHLDRQTVFVARPVQAHLIADHQRRQQRNRADPPEIHVTPLAHIREPDAGIALHDWRGSVKPAPYLLDPGRVWRKSAVSGGFEKESGWQPRLTIEFRRVATWRGRYRSAASAPSHSQHCCC